MRYALATTCFVLGAALAPVAAYAADGDTDRANPATFVKDSVITTKIKTKLAAEHPGSLKHIKVDTDQNGVVWMTGTANTQEEVEPGHRDREEHRRRQDRSRPTSRSRRTSNTGSDLAPGNRGAVGLVFSCHAVRPCPTPRRSPTYRRNAH